MKTLHLRLTLLLFSLLQAAILVACEDDGPTKSALQVRFGDAFPGTAACPLPEHDLTPAVTPAEVAQALADNTAFAFDAYRMAIAGGSDAPANVFLSPHGISVAFAMALPQANDAEAIVENLGFTLPEPMLHRAMNALGLDLARHTRVTPPEGGEAPVITAVQGAWADSRSAVSPETCELYGGQYDAPVARLPFAAEPEQSEALINAWISERTLGHIPELMRGNVGEHTRWVLVSALYFKASWSQPFSDRGTAPGTFTRVDGTTVQAEMMQESQGMYVRHALGIGYEALALPYVSDGLEMVVVMPEPGRFAELEAGLSPSFVRGVETALESAFVEVSLPRFTARTRLELSELLEDPFSSAIHEAWVDVNERGTEAAAATAVSIGDNSAPTPQFSVTVDRPFFFFVRDRENGLILFLGRVLDPTV